jgi:hypothetical protein
MVQNFHSDLEKELNIITHPALAAVCTATCNRGSRWRGSVWMHAIVRPNILAFRANRRGSAA